MFPFYFLTDFSLSGLSGDLTSLAASCGRGDIKKYNCQFGNIMLFLPRNVFIFSRSASRYQIEIIKNQEDQCQLYLIIGINLLHCTQQNLISSSQVIMMAVSRHPSRAQDCNTTIQQQITFHQYLYVCWTHQTGEKQNRTTLGLWNWS